MRRFTILGLLVLTALAVRPAFAQQIKDPAELLPAGTLAYAEVRQIGPLVKEIVSLIEGSALENVPDSLDRLWGDRKSTDFRSPRQDIGAVGLFLSPEVVKEAQRIQGAAIALTGIDAKGEPEYVVIVLPGESAAPRLAMRAMLVMERTRAVGKVEGVTIYRPYYVSADPGGKQQEVRDREPAFAMTSEALLIGSQGAIEATIKRIKGKDNTPSLASTAAYREASKEFGTDPGLFAFAPLAETVAAIAQHPRIGPQVGGIVQAVDRLVNFKAFRAAAYGLSLSKGTLRYRELVLLDPKEKSPVLDLLPPQPVRAGLLHFTPADAVLVAALSNADGEKRWERVVAMLDEAAKLGGVGPGELPSAEIARMEQAIGLNLGKDVFGRIAGISLSLGDPLKVPFKQIKEKKPDFEHVIIYKEVPVVLAIDATDADAAGKLMEEVLPRIYSIITRQQGPKPEVKEVLGQKINTLPGAPQWSFNYGRQGNTIVVGPYATPVAQALANGAGKKGWVGDAKVAAAVRKHDKACTLAVARPFTAFMGALLPAFAGTSKASSGEARPRDLDPPQPPRKDPAPRGLGQVSLQAPPDDPPGKPTVQDEQLNQIRKLLADDGLLTFHVTRQPDRIVEEIELTGLKPIVGRMIDFTILQHLQQREGAAAPAREFEEKRPVPPDRSPE